MRNGQPPPSPVPSEKVLERFRRWARAVKRDILALYLAARDPRVPWYAKAVAGCVAAYALSPIDLIPDFIPLIGYLDELFVLPLGILLATKLVPPDLMAEFRAAVMERATRPRRLVGATLVVCLWILLAGTCAYWLSGRFVL